MDENMTYQDAAEVLEKDNLPPANIIVAGITGTGKSTLINAVFGSELAETGTGRPVTAHIAEYKKDEIPICIWDTVGLELDSAKTKESINSIRDTIASKADSEDHFDHIHAIWYCINSGSNRYQGAEIDFIKSLYSIGVPFIIVLTQCIGDPKKVNSFEENIRNINNSMGMSDIDIVQVCAQDFKLRSGTIEAFGLDVLVNKTIDKLPDFIKGGFIAAQNVSKAQKRECCGEILSKYIDAAINGFWKKIPVVNFFVTDGKIHKMLYEIGRIYNTILPEARIRNAIKDKRMDTEHGFFGIVMPVSKKFDKKVDDLFKKKDKEGHAVPIEKLSKNERAARMIACYGYLFMEAMEALWEECNKDKIKDIEEKVNRLEKIIDEIFNTKPNEKCAVIKEWPTRFLVKDNGGKK